MIKDDVVYQATKVSNYTADGVMKTISLSAHDQEGYGYHMSIIVKQANGKWYYWGKD